MAQGIQRYQEPGEFGAPAQSESDVLAHFAAARAMIRDQLTMPEYRRDHERVLGRLREAAIRGGDDFYYSWTAAGSLIEGPSIKAAQAIINAVGGAAVVPTHVTEPDAWVFTVWLVDRESMTVQARQYRQRRDQRVFSEAKLAKDEKGELRQRQEDIIFSIGQSKAIRNIVTRVFENYSEFAVREAKLILADKAKQNPAHYLARIESRLAKMKIPIERVAKWIGHAPEKWTPDDMVRVGATINAIGEGMADPRELWPDPVYAGGPPPAPKQQPKNQTGVDDGPPPHGEPTPGRDEHPDQNELL